MSEKPKRRFWQLHLSTAIVALLADAALFPLGDWFYREHFGEWRWIVPMAVTYATVLVLIVFVAERFIRRREQA